MLRSALLLAAAAAVGLPVAHCGAAEEGIQKAACQESDSSTCAAAEARGSDEAALLQVKLGLHLQAGPKRAAKAIAKRAKKYRHRVTNRLQPMMGVSHVVSKDAQAPIGAPVEMASDDADEDQHRLNVLRTACLAVIAMNSNFDANLVNSAQETLNQIVGGAAIGDINQEVLEEIEAAYETTQSAQTAEHNGAETSADDVAEQHGGQHDEDVGCSGHCASFQGDMAAANNSQLLLFQEIAAGKSSWVAAGTPWTDAYVPYCFASDVPANIRHLFEAAAQQWTRALPCFRFENVGWRSGSSTDPMGSQRCNSEPAIFVMADPNSGCYSYVGMLPWASQQLQLHSSGCASLGTAIHELGHALGMAHEQSRPDRDSWVVINWDNIQSSSAHNFNIDSNGYAEVDYDYLSVMHYSPFAFAIDRSVPTIEKAPQQGGGHDGVGQRSGLSSYDVLQIEAMYQETNSGCTANAIAGTGCVNLPDDNGNDICTGLGACGGTATQRCCACGGGLEVQCYTGAECPSSPPLPPGPDADCIETGTHPVASCIYRNTCSRTLQFRCAQSGCTFSVPQSTGSWTYASCNGALLTDICDAPDQCQVWSPSPPPAPTTAAPGTTAAPTPAPTTAAPTTTASTTLPPPPETTTTTTTQGPARMLAARGETSCPAGYHEITTQAECQAEAASANLNYIRSCDGSRAIQSWCANTPLNCIYLPRNGYVAFNTAGTDVGSGRARLVCMRD